MSKGRFLLLGIAVGLASCGGGHSGGGTAVVPAPTPTPAATPTPVPSPTPTPTPTYNTAFDFSHSFTFFTPMAEINYQMLLGTPGSIGAKIGGVKASLATDSVDYSFTDRSIRSNLDRLSGNSIAIDTDIERRYIDAQTNERLQTFTYRRPSTDYRYVAFGIYTLPSGRVSGTTQNITTAIYRYHLIGVPTLTFDLPTSGSTTYSVRYNCTLLAGDAASAGADISASLTVNHATGAVSIALPNTAESCLNNGSVARPASLLFNGVLDKTTNEIAGSISSADSGFTGSFTGRLYGPGGVEAGLVFSVGNGGEALVAGEVVGRRG